MGEHASAADPPRDGVERIAASAAGLFTKSYASLLNEERDAPFDRLQAGNTMVLASV
ncbi:MAG: hypothetical protein VB138_00580 [Burkholderia sp.]